MNCAVLMLLISALVSVFAVPALLERRNIRPIRDGGYWGHFLFDFVPRLFTQEEISHYQRHRLIAFAVVFPAALLVVSGIYLAYEFIGI